MLTKLRDGLKKNQIMQDAFDYLSEKENIFKTIIDQYGIPIIPQRPQGFETLVLLILEQQVSIDSAKATFLKIKASQKVINPEVCFRFQKRSIGVLV